MAEELIYKVGVEGTNELGKLETSVEKAGKATNKTTNYFTQMRNELKKARGDMLKYAEGTEEYSRAAAKASSIQSRMNDANAKINAGITDLGQTTKNLTGALGGMAGGFQIVQSTMSLFGIENEETIKTVLKLQQTMAIVQGLGAFAQGINDAQNILKGFRASNVQMNQELQESSQNMEGVSTSSDKMGDSMKNAGKESAVLGSNLAGNTKIANDLSEGLEKIGSDAHIANVQKLSKMTEAYEQQLDAATKMLSSYTEGSAEYNRVLQMVNRAEKNLIETQAELNVVMESGKKATEGGIKVTKDGIEVVEDLSEATEGLGKNIGKSGKVFSSFTKSILTSLGTMAVFLVAIAAVTYGISALVAWLSKVPESVKIKIELEEDVQNQLAEERLKVKKFANDLQLIHRKANKEGKEADIERLKRIREQGKEEMGLTDIQLDNIATVKEDWMLMFDAYLLKAEYTYKKESLMKMKIDAETRIKLEKAAAKLKFDEKQKDGKLPLGWTYEGLEKQAKITGVAKAATETLLVWKDAQQIVDHIREATRIETKELATINKVIADLDKDLANVDFGTGVEETKGGTKETTKPTKAPKFGLRKPDTVEEDLVTKQSEKVVKQREGFTNEEQAIMEEAQRKFDKRQDDSLIKYTEYQIKLGEAIAKDLKIKLEGKEKELQEMEILYDEELGIQNQALEEKTRAHNEELEHLRKLTQDKFDIEEKANKLIEERASVDPKDSAKIAAIDAEIESLQKLYEANDADIAMSKNKISTAKEEIKSIEEKLRKLDLMPEQIKALKDEMDQLTLQIEENSARIVDSLAANMVAMMDMATTYVDSAGAAFQSIANMNADFMQAEDNKLAKEKNNLELSQAYREADSEQQQQMMYELELANYEAKKKTFETNKAFQIGAVITQSASNQIDIIKAWLDPKTGGPLSPANIAVAAAATAANVATTIGSVKQISSTSLEKPVPPVPSGGGPGAGAGIVLSPNKTSLTSREENLNMMYQSGKDKNSENVVRVSDINKVQNKVSVRERNSSY